MAQFETELSRKSKTIDQLERDYQQATAENNMVCEQLLKFKQAATPQENRNPNASEPDAFVDLLKRNHDVMMEKYELYRQRNEQLERTTLEKESLYLKIKTENDVLADQVYTLKRVTEDLKQETTLLTSKLITAQETSKTATEQSFALKVSKDRFEGQFKAVQEQLAMVQKSHDELASKKQTENELISRDLNSVSIRERDTRAKLL